MKKTAQKKKAAKKKRLRKYYARREAEVGEYAEELRRAPLDDTREVVNREGLKIVCFEIAKFAVLIGLLHQADDLSAQMLEDCMINIFDLVKDVQWNAHRAQSKAGLSLREVISESMKKFTGCALHLLRCTVGYGWDGHKNKVTSSALKVLDVYETTVAAMPLTNTAAIGNVLECHEATIREIIDLYEILKRVVTLTEKEQRIVTAVMRVASGFVQVIEELRRALKEWNESDSSKSTITSMENLAVLASRMCTDIDEMMDEYPPPPRKIPKILKGLDRVNNNVIAMEKILLLHSRYASEEFARKSDSLKNWIGEAKSLLSN